MPDTEQLPPGETPPIAVTPTAWQSIIIALALAMLTAYGVASNLLIYASTRDIAGLIVYLRGNDFLQGISAVTLIVGTGGLIWRTLRRKARELYLEANVSAQVAYLKGGPDDPMVAPPTRAREATTAPVNTRLVNGSVLLHAGGRQPVAPLDRHPTDLVVNGELISTTPEGLRYNAGKPVADIAPAQPAAAPEDDGLPSIDMDAFDKAYAAWMVEGAKGSFGEFLTGLGWRETSGKWAPPSAAVLNDGAGL